jgi:hypothetical protein
MKLLRIRFPRPRRLVILRRRWVAVPAALAAICLLCVVVTLPSYVTASAQRQLPIYSVQREYKVCSLTFDAA